jgi:hypothetical protein
MEQRKIIFPHFIEHKQVLKIQAADCTQGSFLAEYTEM